MKFLVSSYDGAEIHLDKKRAFRRSTRESTRKKTVP